MAKSSFLAVVTFNYFREKALSWNVWQDSEYVSEVGNKQVTLTISLNSLINKWTQSIH